MKKEGPSDTFAWPLGLNSASQSVVNPGKEQAIIAVAATTPQNIAMIRKTFVMEVHPDKHQEYIERHNPIWPELEMVLKSHGVHNYTIALNPSTSQLFGYVEIEDRSRWQAIASSEICKKWWAHMQDLMTTNADNSPAVTELVEVFHLP